MSNEAPVPLDPIIVATAVDVNFLPLTEVVATSIAANATSGRQVEYHVLYDGPDNATARRLSKWRRGDVSVRLRRMDNPLARFGKIGGFPPATLFRLMVPEVLGEFRRLIYLDADVIVETDLAPLFDSPLSGRPLGATLDRDMHWMAFSQSPGREVSSAAMRTYLVEALGLDTADKQRSYMQSGVLVMDTAPLRAMKFTELAVAAVEEVGQRLKYPDQCVMNKLMTGRIATLDPRWNVTVTALKADAMETVTPEFKATLELQRSEQWITHYASKRKPWLRLSTPAGNRWWRYAIASGHFLGYVPLLYRERVRAVLQRPARNS